MPPIIHYRAKAANRLKWVKAFSGAPVQGPLPLAAGPFLLASVSPGRLLIPQHPGSKLARQQQPVDAKKGMGEWGLIFLFQIKSIGCVDFFAWFWGLARKLR